MNHPRRWFVVPVGDRLNGITAEAFPDANFHTHIHIHCGKKQETKPAWEVEKSNIASVCKFLLAGDFKIRVKVAVQVGDNKIRWAQRKEYDDTFRKGEVLRGGVLKGIQSKGRKPLFVDFSKPDE